MHEVLWAQGTYMRQKSQFCAKVFFRHFAESAAKIGNQIRDTTVLNTSCFQHYLDPDRKLVCSAINIAPTTTLIQEQLEEYLRFMD